MRRLLVIILLLGLAPAASAEPTAVTWTVTNYADAPEASGGKGAPGSLRYILTAQAGPNDTILFDRPAQLTVNARIRVPQKLSKLTIDGSVKNGRVSIRYLGGRRGADAAVGLYVLADQVTIRNLIFEDASLAIGAQNVVESPNRTQVMNSLFTGARGALLAGQARRMLVQGNVFEGRPETALSASGATDLRVLRNRFAGSPSQAIFAEAVDRMVVEDNTFERGVARLTMDGGHVSGNHFQGGSLVVNTVVDDEHVRAVRVERNDATGGSFTFRAEGRLTVEANRLSAPRSVLLGCITNASRPPELRYVNNTVVGGGGVIVECPRREPIEIAGGRVESTAGPSLSVRDGEAEVRSIVLTRAGGAGLVVSPGAKARVVGGRIVGNRRAGVLVNKGAGKTVVSRVAMGSNGGAGIDLAPAGVSPKAGTGAPKVVYDKKKAKLRGTACRGCTVELFESEDGDKIGNKGHGEGIRLIGVVKADGQGRFVFPQKGDLDCPPSGLVTATATHMKMGTSEFSPDVECSCIVSRAFGLDPQSVPRTGFANFGLAVVFEPGTKIGAIELEDTKTDKRPGPNDLGPELAWSELHNESPRTPGRPLFDDFFVNVGYRRESTTPATGPVKVWRYRVAYDPPRAAKGRCRAVVEHVNLPPPRG